MIVKAALKEMASCLLMLVDPFVLRVISLSNKIRNLYFGKFYKQSPAQQKKSLYANLNYYKEVNLKLVREGTKKRIVFIGDSITEEWGRIMPEFFSNKQYIGRSNWTRW